VVFPRVSVPVRAKCSRCGREHAWLVKMRIDRQRKLWILIVRCSGCGNEWVWKRIGA